MDTRISPGKIEVLIASPVRQKPAILQEFLWSLAQLETAGLKVAYAFIDDNDEESVLLREFARRKDAVKSSKIAR